MDELTMRSLAKIHWERHRPKMVAHLKASKKYEAALENNARIAMNVLSNRLRLGSDLKAAEKYVLKTWIFLPDEKTEPTLDADLMPFPQPEEAIAGALASKAPDKNGAPSERHANKHHYAATSLTS